MGSLHKLEETRAISLNNDMFIVEESFHPGPKNDVEAEHHVVVVALVRAPG